MQHRLRRTSLLASVAAIIVLGATACSGSTSTPAASGGAGAAAQPLTAGVIPVSDIGPLYMAKQNGSAKKDGFDVTLQSAGSSTEIIQAMQSGQVQIGYGGSTGVFQAVQNGIDLTIIAAASATPDDPSKGINDILVKGDSPLKTAKDLEGKTVAVNAPGGYTQLLADITITQAGGNPKKVKYVQMGVADQPAALASGAIDAYVAGEPFGTLGREQNGFKTLANPFIALSDHAVVAGVWYALKSQVEADPAKYKKIQTMINNANTYALNHDKELRENIAAFTKIDPKLAERIRLGSYGKLPDTVENVQPIADWSFKLGYVKQKVDVSKLIWDGK